LPTVNYRDTHQTVNAKVREDHFVSKLGELAVASVFRQYGCEVGGPDFNIYPGDQKSWDDNLIVDGVGLAGKTQSKKAAEKYGLSWTFQDAPTRRDRILDNPEAWLCFVWCNYTVPPYLCVVFPPVQLKMVVFGEPFFGGGSVLFYALQKKPQAICWANDLPTAPSIGWKKLRRFCKRCNLPMGITNHCSPRRERGAFSFSIRRITASPNPVYTAKTTVCISNLTTSVWLNH
jgi:hypothetical protein